MKNWDSADELLKQCAPQVTGLLKLMANEQRLQLLCKMRDREISVGELADLTGQAQSAVSQHLSRLRAGELVATRRDSRTIYYRIADPHVSALMGFLCDTFGKDEKGHA